MQRSLPITNHLSSSIRLAQNIWIKFALVAWRYDVAKS